MDFHKNVVHSNTSQSQNNESAERYKNTVKQRIMLAHNQEVKQFIGLKCTVGVKLRRV